MGVTWAIGWAIFGVLIGITSRLFPGRAWDAFFNVFDAPLPALAMPGFVGGVIFSIVLGIVARGRKFSELSLPKFATWGAIGGLMLSLVPDAMVAVGLAELGTSELSLGRLTALIAGPLIVLSSASAAGSLLLARKAEGQGAPGDGEDSGGPQKHFPDPEVPAIAAGITGLEGDKRPTTLSRER
jgi:hypothetical protein